MASSRSLPAGLVTRVRIVLLSAAGKMNQQIARQLGLSNATVGKWRRRFVEQGVSGLHDELRPGRPRPISDERVALDKSEGSVKGIVVLGGASSTAAAPERLRTKTLEISG